VLLPLLLALAGLALPSSVSAAPATTGTVAGQVVDDLGRPVEDAQVTVWATTDPAPVGPYGPSASVAFARTDALGRYVVTDVPPRDDYVLFFRKDGYQPVDTHVPSSLSTWRTFGVAAGQTVTEDAALVEYSVTVRGRVVDFDGRGIAGADTSFGPTADDGTFEGRTVPGDTYLRASADGYLPLATPPHSTWEPDVRIRSERGQTIDGIVARLRRVPTQDCWGQDGNWTPAGGFRYITDANGNGTQSVASGPPLFPYAEHLCPDTDDAAYRDRSEFPVRVGVPMAPLPKPAAAAPIAPKPVGATGAPVVGTGTLRAPARPKLSRGGTFNVAARCSAACGGRVVATVRRPKSRGRRAADVVVAAGQVAAGTGTRNIRLRLNTTGRRAVRGARSGVVVTLRWVAPDARTGTAGPKVRLTASR
jgi:hypothetical protein